MEIPVPDETTIRDYLLGRLDPASEIVERVDELMLTDMAFSESLGVVEDDIIEEYLEGTLNLADKQSVETHFLRPLERQRKLQNARLLTRRLSGAANAPEGNNLLQIKAPSHPIAPAPRRSNFRVYAEVAAALLFAASVIYLSQSRHRLQSTLGESIQQLTQEREHSVQLNQQLQSARDLAQPPVAMLSLFQPGILRGRDVSLPNLKIGAGTSKVHVELAMTSSNTNPYNLRLESAGETVWSLDHLNAFTSRDGSILIFEIPATALAAGENKLTISQASASSSTYSFTVSKQ